MARSTWDKFLDAMDFINDPLGSRYVSRAIDRLLFPKRKTRSRTAQRVVYDARIATDAELDHHEVQRRRSEIDSLLERGKVPKAERLLLDWVNDTEAEVEHSGRGVSSIPYLKLAILYRKDGRAKDEIQILRRYLYAPHGVVGPSERMLRRLRYVDPKFWAERS